jgi:subtilisin family serine protease
MHPDSLPHPLPRPGPRRAATLALGLLALAACAPDAGILEPAAGPLGQEQRLPERKPGGGQPPTVIQDRYVVILSDEARDGLDHIKEVVAKYDGELHYVYRHAVQGFAATLPPKAVEDLRHHPYVKVLEPDHVVTSAWVQTDATWGLDRVDQMYQPLNSYYQYNRTGAGVTAYVLDTGIQTAHAQFGGRAWVGYDAFGGNGQDCHGHGTHVAGTIGGSTWGVAKQVSLVSVRVLDCSGNGVWIPDLAQGLVSTVIAGMDWVVGHHGSDPAVALLSAESDAGVAMDYAVNKLVADGVVVVAAAGNGSTDACQVTPARVPAAITVGATRWTDARASFSNHGACVDLFAPGESIRSAALNGGSLNASGTSMAAAHAAGGAALVLQGTPTAAPAAVASTLNAWATQGQLSSLGTGSPNRLLNVNRMSARVGYRAHVKNLGWLADVYDYTLAGTEGQALRMEALTVQLLNAPAGVGVAYRAHLKGTGWQSTRYNGQEAGTTGQGRRMEAVKIWLTNAPAGMGICYRVHVKNLGWMSEVCDGAQAGTTGQSRRIEAIQIRVY